MKPSDQLNINEVNEALSRVKGHGLDLVGLEPARRRRLAGPLEEAADLAEPARRALKTLTSAVKWFERGGYESSADLAAAAQLDIKDFLSNVKMASGKKSHGSIKK